MNFDYTDTQAQIRAAVKDLCARFGPEYWRQLAQDGKYPDAFVGAMAEAGWLAALIPEEYGGAGLPLLDACLILQEVNQNGGSAVHCHAQMYTMASIMRHGSEAQKRHAARIGGSLRRPSASPANAGSTRWRSRPSHAVLALRRQRPVDFDLARSYAHVPADARTTPLDEVKKKTDGLSLPRSTSLGRRGGPVAADRTMINHHTFQVFIDNLELSDDDRIGEEGKGFHYLLDSLHSERLLVSSEAIGDGHWFIGKAAAYGRERVVFDRPIGSNQGVQFPIARAHMNVRRPS